MLLLHTVVSRTVVTNFLVVNLGKIRYSSANSQHEGEIVFNGGAASATLPRMAKKKNEEAPKKGETSKPTTRVNVGVPGDWHGVMRQLAAKKRQPLLWVLLDLVAVEAEKFDLPCPPPPWEEDLPQSGGITGMTEKAADLKDQDDRRTRGR
jgi:hypothetical protein